MKMAWAEETKILFWNDHDVKIFATWTFVEFDMMCLKEMEVRVQSQTLPGR
jgi:hypothetical protein